MEEKWFTDRIGAEVLRNGKAVKIESYKHAKYYYSLQPHFTFEDKVQPRIHISTEACLSCES